MTSESILLYNTLEGQHLLRRAPKAEIVRDLCGLQAQFSRNPEISLRLRSSDYAPDTWDSGLIKIWTHRGTIHVIAEDELGLYLSAADQSGPFRDGHWGMSVAEQERWAPFIAEQVAAGNDTRDGLKAACRAAGMDEDLVGQAFYGWGGLIKEMCWRGLLACRTGTDKRYLVPRPPVWMDRDKARFLLMRRYFEHFGPSSLPDCRSFFGWPAEQMRPLWQRLQRDLLCTDLGGRKYYHARELVTDAPLPECVLLAGFDQLVLGYRDRARFLDRANMKKLTNPAGIVFPAVLLRGKARARWKLEGERVAVVPFERLYKKDEAGVRRAVRAALGLPGKAVRFEE